MLACHASSYLCDASGEFQSSYQLMKQLEPFVKNRTQDYEIFSKAVHQTLKRYLPELQGHANIIADTAAQYFGVEEDSALEIELE